MSRLKLERNFDCSVEQLFDAWAHSKNMQQWWGAVGFTTEVKEFDFSVGGRFHYVFKSEGGFRLWGIFYFEQVVAPKELSFTSSFSDEAANIVAAPEIPFGKHWPLKVRNHVVFKEQNGASQIILEAEPIHAGDDAMATFEQNKGSILLGLNTTFDRLELFLSQ